MDGRTDRVDRKNGWVSGLTDGRTDGRMEGWKDGQTA